MKINIVLLGLVAAVASALPTNQTAVAGEVEKRALKCAPSTLHRYIFFKRNPVVHSFGLHLKDIYEGYTAEFPQTETFTHQSLDKKFTVQNPGAGEKVTLTYNNFKKTYTKKSTEYHPTADIIRWEYHDCVNYW
ncbi:hypothetical protein BGZ75_007712 [Mortierella antarctica]|nr:hypothetical protein BGZ75_007712 [Mortierella antarctica]